MIKPNELRIGNLVCVKNNSMEKVVSISVDHILTLPIKPEKANSCWRLKENDIEGIPITEEWLLKFGFERSKDAFDGHYGFHYSHIYHEIVIHNTFGYWAVSAGYYSEDIGQLSHIKYVHQLQNLYFALTGEELTIKE